MSVFYYKSILESLTFDLCIYRVESFNIIKPSPLLQPYVSHYWSLRTSGDTPAGERVIPTGAVSLVFHRADLMKSLTAGNNQPRVFISGISTGYSDLLASGVLNMLVVVFHPLGGGLLFPGIPLDEFRNASVCVDETDEPGLIELSDKVLCATSDDGAVALIEHFLVSRLKRYTDQSHSRIRAAVNHIASKPMTTVTLAADTACLSNRQFHRLFSAHVGTKPKEFIRIVRFQRALHTLQTQPAINFAQLAAGCGFYDQGHMIKEFRSFSGYTPSEYLAVCDPYSDFFSKP